MPAITGHPAVLLAAPPPDCGWIPRLGRTVTLVFGSKTDSETVLKEGDLWGDYKPAQEI